MDVHGRLLHKQDPLSSHILPSAKPAEIHSRCKVRLIKPDMIIPGILNLVDKPSDFLAKQVVNDERDALPPGQAIFDNR